MQRRVKRRTLDLRLIRSSGASRAMRGVNAIRLAAVLAKQS